MIPRARQRRRRRGAIGVAMVGALIVVELVIVVAVVGGGLHQDLTLQRIDTNRAFYAAEGGVNMALREAWTGADEDGDGTVGGISDNADPDDDPAIGAAAVSVSAAEADGATTLTAVGWSERARRRIEMHLQSD
jgi:Tfp pilus assembly protein PilX